LIKSSAYINLIKKVSFLLNIFF